MQTVRNILAAASLIGLASAAGAADVVLVAGASGKSGQPLVKILSEQGYAVRAMVRDQAKAASLGGDVEIVEADVTRPETLAAAVKGAAYVISTLGAGSAQPPNNPENVDYRGVANLVDAAKAAGVKHLVLMSSLGAGDTSPATPLNKVFGMVLMWKGKGEDHLRASGVPYTIVRPGGLSNCEPGKTGLKIMAADATGGGVICRADVGLVMADALKNPDAAGKTIGLVSDKASAPGAWQLSWKDMPKD